MRTHAPFSLLAFASLVAGEVPQEHSHKPIVSETKTQLDKNNPLEILDPIFALLGNAAAAKASNKVAEADLDCLQQIVADQAFTNAKADGDLNGQVNALLFRTLERNTLQVGLASELCKTVQAVNPEIAALTQIQDPASPEAANNKGTILKLATQIASIGGDPLLALNAGTFAPGQLGDPTAAGNTCNDADDAAGCIFSQNLLVKEVTEEEIQAAVTAAGAGAGAGANGGIGNVNDGCAAGNGTANNNAGKGKGKDAKGKDAKGKANEAKGKGKGKDSAAGAGADAAAGGAAIANIQTFTGDLGGAAPAVSFDPNSNRPFNVNGATFLNVNGALTRSCDIQNNACFNAANSGQLTGGTAQCQQQQQDCIASIATSAAQVGGENAKGKGKRRSVTRSIRRRLAKVSARQNLDFGSCSNPGIVFQAGLDGRKESSFGPANKADFNHGSALKPGIITSFICQRLESSCKASEEAVATCQQAAAAANSLSGQAAVSAFNGPLGV